MTQNADTIRYRPDGSIDIGHYIAEAHKARSCQAHRLAAKTARIVRKPRLGILATVAALFRLPVGNG